MLVSFQTVMPILVALLAILTAWLLVERPLRIRVVPVLATGVTTVRISQTGQISQSVPIELRHLREARRGSPDAPPGGRLGVLPARVQRQL
ncbi:MAG: hypothetical protein ISQ06_09010 [Planctomycetaceae bacterium]|jgi:hypothetical protein|nr:hypothetical protein [Planctomycetaceae bacterium]